MPPIGYPCYYLLKITSIIKDEDGKRSTAELPPKYKEKAVPLITIDSKERYTFGEEAQSILAGTPGKISVVAVAGMYRTGKSYLLNRMLLNRSDGFGVGPTINPCTKGLWMWGRPIVHRTSRDEILNVFIVDSEGMGACEEDSTHDSRVFALTMLLSSCFIYNSMGIIDENAISSLGLVVGLGKYLQIRANQANSEESRNSLFSPEFYWVVRDFSLQLINKEGMPIQGTDYLENALSLQTDKNSDSVDNRNAIRKAIKEYFPKRDCITLVRPLTNQDNLQMLDKMDFEQLRPEFVEQVLAFRKTVFGGLKPKTLKGKLLTGRSFCDLITSYVQAVNNGGVPVIETTWQYICRNECQQALEQTFDFLEASINEKIKKRLPLTEQELRKLRQQVLRETYEMFDRLTPNNDFCSQYREQLVSKLNSKFSLLRQENEAEHIKAAQAFLAGEFDYIDRRVRNSEYKRVSEYVKEIQLFYEYYKKKCATQPAKANVFVLEFLMKRLADTSVSMTKLAQNETDKVRARLKEVEEQADRDITDAENRLLKERSQLNERISSLQTSRRQLVVSKESLTEQLERTRQQLKLFVEDYSIREASLKRQTLKIQTELRNQLQILEHTLDERSKEHSQIVSTLQRDQILLENKLEYTEKNLLESNNRIREGENTLRNAKSDCERSLKEAEKKADSMKSTLQIKISKLEMTLQQKNGELAHMEQHNGELNITIEDMDRKLKSSKQEAEQLIKRIREELVYDHGLQMQKIKRDYQETITELAKKQRKLESDLAAKDNSLKMVRLELEKEAALLAQKLQFCEAELCEKNDRVKKTDEDYDSLMAVVSLKDEEISNIQGRITQLKETADKGKRQLENELSNLKVELEELRGLHEEASERLSECLEKLELTTKDKRSAEEVVVRLGQQLRIVESNRNQTLLERQLKFQEQLKRYQTDLESEREENRLRIEEIKRNSEGSLIQLKNFYEIERQRLQKRLLEERRRIEHVESEALQMLAQEYSRYKEASEDEIGRLQDSIKEAQTKQRQIEQSLLRQLDEAKLSVDQLNKQRSCNQEQFAYKEEQFKEELRRVQSQLEEERSTFMRKVDNITHEMSKKEKELLQLNTRREHNESLLKQKQQQLQDLQKEYSNQIQQLTQRTDDFRAKYAAMKDAHMELKIETEKEIALTRQKNEFLTTKVAELVKERQATSSKNLAERPNDRSDILKEQVERLTQELSVMELKLEKAKKSARDTESLLTKQLSQQQREKSVLTEKLYMTEERNKQLQSRSTSRGEQHMKDIDEMRERYAVERELHTAENQKLRNQLVSRESQYDELYSRHQREVALLEEKVKFIEHQKDQLKRELEDNRRKLDLAVTQLQRRERSQEEEELKRKSLHLERKYSSQLESLRQMLKRKTEEADDQAARFRAELRTAKQRNSQLQDRLLRGQKSKRSDELLLQQNEQLKRQRDELFLSHRAELARENDDNRRKLAEVERKYKVVEKKNAEFNFLLEKEHAKWTMDRDSLIDKITELEEALKERNFLQKSIELQRSAVQIRKASLDRRRPLQQSSSSELISPSSTSSVKRSGFFDLKLS